MSDLNYLPRNFGASYARAAAASDAVRNMLLAQHPGYNHLYSNFLGDALTADWGAASTNGTGAAVTVAGGLLTLTSGTDNDGYAGQGYDLEWTGDNGIYMATQLSLNTITTAKLEVGFTDAIDDAGAVLVKATPTGTANDFSVLVFDTDDNTDLDLISEIDNGGPSADAEGITPAVAAGVDFAVEMRVQNDATAAFVNGAHVGSGSHQGGTAVTPWVFAQTRTTAARIVTVNYLLCTGPNGVAIL